MNSITQMRSRIFIPLMLTTLLTSCVANPYRNVENLDEDGALTKYKFKYGKYCGPGHPAFESKPGTDKRTTDLLSIWPPVDDIDLMCFAHDMCYENVGKRSVICDEAIGQISNRAGNLFGEQGGCRNLIRLIGSGLFAKFWGEETTGGGRHIIGAGKLLWSLPGTAIAYGVNTPSRLTYGYPKEEGSCFAGMENRLHTDYVVSNFESLYEMYADGYEYFSRKKPTKEYIDIKTPNSNNWINDKLLVQQIQTHLESIGFKLGPADGIWGKRTEQAFLGYGAGNSLVINKESRKEILTELLSDLHSDSFSRWIAEKGYD